MNILYLTELVSQRVESDVSVFRQTGHNIVIVSAFKEPQAQDWPTIDAPIIDLYRDHFMPKCLMRAAFPYWKVLLSRTPRTKYILSSVLSQYDIDLVIALWSTGVVPEMWACQTLAVKAPIVFRVHMFPAAITPLLLKLEQAYCTIPIANLDAIVYTTVSMRDYMKAHFGRRGTPEKELVMPDYQSKRYFYTRRPPLLSEEDREPHIVFLGTTESQSHNNINSLLRQLVDEGIHVHVLKSPRAEAISSPYLHRFSRYPLLVPPEGSLTLGDFITQFDACLVASNLEKVIRSRFDNTIPNRLVAALTGAIPIAIPKGILRGSVEFALRHGIGFTFDDPADLKGKLLDKTYMRDLRDRVIEHAPQLHAENRFPELEDFLYSVVRSKSNPSLHR